MRRLAGLAATAVLLLSGCQIAEVETPDPASIPAGSIEPRAATPTGPVVELGSGVTSGIGWRYSIYPSDDGWCTQLETGSATTAGCGDLLPAEGRAFGGVAQGGPIVDGIVTEEVATVWLIADGVVHLIPATLMSLEDAGLAGQAFVGIAPAEANITHIQALKLNGEVLESYELP